MAEGRGKQIAVGLLVVVAVTALAWSRGGFLGESENAHIPDDFPHPFIAPADNGHPDRVVVVRARMAPFGPQDLDGARRFPAWRCDNPACDAGDPFVFAYGDPQQGASSTCPACTAAGNRDPTQVMPYATPEGAAILERVRAGF